VSFPKEYLVMAVKLFVGGLAFATTSDRLRDTFAAVGTVASADVVKDPTGQSRGFGFVEMETTEAATDAISRLHGRELDGRVLRVELSQKKLATGGGSR
jgi:RNA recognition motif-containing protein